ncbi:MAG: hypothetical protein L6246_07085 [Thermodesulfovibrionales bacterium]|nr:hypothetical protein [Thermodesulfovibrionales bacterium]
MPKREILCYIYPEQYKNFRVRGKGKAMIGKKLYEMNFMDTLYISPNTPHQLSNPFGEPFGFLCIVNAKRDKPRIIA